MTIEFPCPDCGYHNAEVDIICDQCGKFLVSIGRKISFLFIVSILISLALFKRSQSIWPMYLIISLGVIHAYAFIYSRGEAFTYVTNLFFIITVFWTIWEIHSWLYDIGLFNQYLDNYWLNIQSFTTIFKSYIAILVWVLCVIWGIFLGKKKALPGVKLLSSYFLGTGGFIFGLWANWAIFLQQSHYHQLVFNVAIFFALLIPMFLLIFLLIQNPIRENKGRIISTWFFLFTAYLFSTEFLTNLIDIGLCVFLPKLIRMSPIERIDVPFIIQVLKWRNPFATVFFVLAIISLAASSLNIVFSEFTQKQPDFYVKEISRLVGTITANISEKIFIYIYGGILRIIYLIILISNFIGQFFKVFLDNLIKSFMNVTSYLFQMLRYLVFPVLSFSFLSSSVILTLEHFQLFRAGNADFNPLSLWGESLTVMFLVLLCCNASFGFVSSTNKRFLYAGTEAVMVMGFIIYSVVSISLLVFPLIWYSFKWSTNWDLLAVNPGPMLWINSCFFMVIVFLMTLSMFLTNTYQNGLHSNKSVARFLLVFKVLPVFVLLIIILYFGLPLLSKSICL